MAKIPARFASLPRDSRGYPIPWNVLRGEDGTPFFTVNDDRKTWRAIRENRCPICGATLGKWKWFVGGPRSAFDENGWYLDLPGHHDCIQFALAICPYLAMPKYLGRVDVVHKDKLPPAARVLIDNTMIPERPEVFVAVASERVTVRPRGPVLPFLRPTPPLLGVEYWRHGARLSLKEALPYLRTALGATWSPPELE